MGFLILGLVLLILSLPMTQFSWGYTDMFC